MLTDDAREAGQLSQNVVLPQILSWHSAVYNSAKCRYTILPINQAD